MGDMMLEHVMPFAISLCSAVAAVAVALVAYNQYHVARDKFRLELFDKRFVVYCAVCDFLESIKGPASVDLVRFNSFKLSTRECYFLFGPEVILFVNEIELVAGHAICATVSLLDDPVDDERKVFVAQRREAFDCLMDKLDSLQAVFEPYLGFSSWVKK